MDDTDLLIWKNLSLSPPGRQAHLPESASYNGFFYTEGVMRFPPANRRVYSPAHSGRPAHPGHRNDGPGGVHRGIRIAKSGREVRVPLSSRQRSRRPCGTGRQWPVYSPAPVSPASAVRRDPVYQTYIREPANIPDNQFSSAGGKIHAVSWTRTILTATHSDFSAGSPLHRSGIGGLRGTRARHHRSPGRIDAGHGWRRLFSIRSPGCQ